QGCEARRPPGRAADSVRADRQPKDGRGARPRSANLGCATRRRGDRMSTRREFITLLGGAAFVWPVHQIVVRGGREIMTNKSFAVAVFILTVIGMAAVPTAQAAPCPSVTLTGTQSGPPVFNGVAGPGTLVRYGDEANNCGAVKLQF